MTVYGPSRPRGVNKNVKTSRKQKQKQKRKWTTKRKQKRKLILILIFVFVIILFFILVFFVFYFLLFFVFLIDVLFLNLILVPLGQHWSVLLIWGNGIFKTLELFLHYLPLILKYSNRKLQLHSAIIFKKLGTLSY